MINIQHKNKYICSSHNLSRDGHPPIYQSLKNRKTVLRLGFPILQKAQDALLKQNLAFLMTGMQEKKNGI